MKRNSLWTGSLFGERWKKSRGSQVRKKKKPGLKFNPGLVLTGVRTTEPSRTFTDNHSLRSRRLEVVGERENGRARGRHERGVVSCRVVRVSFSRTRFFVWPLLPSVCYAGYDNHLSTKETFFSQRWPLWRGSNESTNSRNPTKLKIRRSLTGWFIY